MHLHLNLKTPTGMLQDTEGYRFETLKGAVNEAILSARQLMGDKLRKGKPLDTDYSFSITDEHGSVLAEVSFADALRTPV